MYFIQLCLFVFVFHDFTLNIVLVAGLFWYSLKLPPLELSSRTLRKVTFHKKSRLLSEPCLFVFLTFLLSFNKMRLLMPTFCGSSEASPHLVLILENSYTVPFVIPQLIITRIVPACRLEPQARLPGPRRHQLLLCSGPPYQSQFLGWTTRGAV